jgi:hypothetical protein
MSYDNTNSGMLARNDKKETEKHPDFKGSINVDGVEYWLSAWVREGKEGGKMAGRKFFSLSVSPKEQAAPKPKATSFDQLEMMVKTKILGKPGQPSPALLCLTPQRLLTSIAWEILLPAGVCQTMR